MANDVELLMAERAITRVVCSYSRGIDRRDLEAVRDCYWPDATDDHGSYRGGIDGFITFVDGALARFERTNHFLGNIMIDVDLDTGRARAETYCVAYHRYCDPDGRPTDMTAGLRYVDRFDRRQGSWRIARRVCAFDWRRTDVVDGDGGFAPSYVRGLAAPHDIVYSILDR
jgi:ketosteroid isomerase-like protein